MPVRPPDRIYFLLLLLLFLLLPLLLLQMIIRSGRPLANDHSDGPPSCNLSSGKTSLLQMIMWRDRPLSNDHLERPASHKLSSVTPVTESPLPGSRFNLADLSRTICSCLMSFSLSHSHTFDVPIIQVFNTTMLLQIFAILKYICNKVRFPNQLYNNNRNDLNKGRDYIRL